MKAKERKGKEREIGGCKKAKERKGKRNTWMQESEGKERKRKEREMRGCKKANKAMDCFNFI